MSALKPCPYCGGDATLFGTTLEGWVGCTNRACPAQPSVFPKSTGGKDIAAAWNTRAADTVNADLLAALPDLSSVIGWLENGCEPVAAATELRIYQNRIRAAIALTPDALRAAKGHLGDLADSIHAAYWTGPHGNASRLFEKDARAHLTSLAAAMGYRLVPAEGETK